MRIELLFIMHFFKADFCSSLSFVRLVFKSLVSKFSKAQAPLEKLVQVIGSSAIITIFFRE